MKAQVELRHASRLINHGPTVLVSSLHAGRRNVMAAAWSMPVEFTPPRVAVVIDKSTFTAEQVRATGCFALSLAGAALADLTWTVGSVSGRDTAPDGPDKFTLYGVESFEGPALGLPLVEGCVAWMECRVIPEPHPQQAYDTFFAEVVSAQADSRVFRDGRWQLDGTHPALHTLHHLGGGMFATAGAGVQARQLRARPVP